MRSAVAKAHEQLGGLDILVSNAGIFERRLLQDTSDEEFDRVMAVNLRGTYIAIKTAAPLMPRGGRIINMSSTFGARFDMEMDAVSTLVLATLLGHFDKAGVWVLLSG